MERFREDMPCWKVEKSEPAGISILLLWHQKRQAELYEPDSGVVSPAEWGVTLPQVLGACMGALPLGHDEAGADLLREDFCYLLSSV